MTPMNPESSVSSASPETGRSTNLDRSSNLDRSRIGARSRPFIAASLGLAVLAGCTLGGTVVNNGLPPGTTASTSPGTVDLRPPATVVHDGGIVFVAQKGLLKDRTDGFKLVGNSGATYRTQALLTGVTIQSETQQPDNSWTYLLAESTSSFMFAFQLVAATSRNQATATGSFEVPDQHITKHFRVGLEATESVPAEAPAGTLAQRLRIALIKDAIPLRGEALMRRVYFPAATGAKDHDWRKITTSLDLRFEMPGVPSVHGQPFVIKKIESNFIAQAQGDDLPLLEDEQQVWPDGMVLQQVLSRQGDLKGFTLKGTLILPDAKRTPINFERRVDLAQDTAMTTLRTLDGIVLELRYGTAQVFQRGELRDARDNVLGTIKAVSANETWLTYPDGATESIKVD